MGRRAEAETWCKERDAPWVTTCPSHEVLRKPAQPCPGTQGTAHAAARGCRHAQVSRGSVSKRDSPGQPFLPCTRCFLRNKPFFSIQVLHTNIKSKTILWFSLVLSLPFHSTGVTNYFWPKYLAWAHTMLFMRPQATFWYIPSFLSKNYYIVMLQKMLVFKSDKK